MSSLISLEKIRKENFKGKKVYIPLYQRNYKWNADMAAKLASDLLKQFEEDNTKEYNLGVLTLYESKDDEIQILDGQQRLITLSLIMKALSFDNDDWFKLYFERDNGFDEESKRSVRFDYIYNDIEHHGIDVDRMKCNINKIKDEMKSFEFDEKEFIYYILNNVKLLCRETKREPIDEFLNMNFKKTPFCSADHIKTYMVLDADKSEEEISITDVQELWKKLERVLFQVEDCNGLENEMYSLIKMNYINDILEMNRMEILFYDRYLEEHSKGKEASKTAYKYYENAYMDALKEEYERLLYYYDVMKSVLDEISIVDNKGVQHPNYNALNAYNLLCKKNNGTHFFEIIGLPENINGQYNVTEVLGKHFNLTGRSHEEINIMGNKNAQNQFLETMLSSKNDFLYEGGHKQDEHSISEKYYVKNNKEFEKVYNSFNGYFNEYIALIEKGKSVSNECETNTMPARQTTLALPEDLNTARMGEIDSVESVVLEAGTKTLFELFDNPNIEKIKIPSIQRDYVMGSSKSYLKEYMQHITFRCSWSNYRMYQNNNGEHHYEELENILFKHNNDKKIFKFDIIDRKTAGRKDTYNRYKRCLIDPPIVKDFRRFGIDSVYGSFCQRVNNLVPLNEEFNKEVFDEVSSYPKKFNTGCIMGYIDEDKTFWVYDGQQRLVTSIVLIALSYLSGIQQKKGYYKLLKKFSFDDREGANKCLAILLNRNCHITDKPTLDRIKENIDDKSSYSIYKLIENYSEFRDDITVKINPDYLLRGMSFEFAIVDKIDDVEQLFIEINEGVKLTADEQYKAELNYVLKNILDESKAKEMLRLIDNKWLDYFRNEVNEVKFLKYCVKMASFEVNGYSDGYDEGSLKYLNDEIIDLVKVAMDKYVVASGKYKEKMNEYYKSNDEIELWAYLASWQGNSELNNKKEAEFMSSKGKIYFEMDFVELIILYKRFTLIPSSGKNTDETGCYATCYDMIKEYRVNRCLVVPAKPSPEGKEDVDKEQENFAEKVYRQMLSNRTDQFEFYEISKWEKGASNYDVVENNKRRSYALMQLKAQNKLQELTIYEDINISEFIERRSVPEAIQLCKNAIHSMDNSIYIDENLSKSIIMSNPEFCSLIFEEKNKRSNDNGVYYFYMNERWFEKDIKNEYSLPKTDLSKEILKNFRKGKMITEIKVNTKTIENSRRTKTIYDILTGLWYSEKVATEFDENTNESGVNVKDISEVNFKVFKGLRVDLSEIDDLLYKYKICHDDVKPVFEKYIINYYRDNLIHDDVLTKLYYIVKAYLSEHTDIRKNVFRHFEDINNTEGIKKRERPLFLDEDYADQASNEYTAYCKQRGY